MSKAKVSEYAIDERVVKRQVGGEVVEVVEELLVNPKGHVKVELRDADSGKLTHVDEGDNFIAPQWAISARSYQRMGWGRWALNMAKGIDYPGNGAHWQPYQFPNSHFACWNSSVVEDPINEHVIQTDAQGIVAWAGRLPVGSPAGSRGQVNIATSSWSPTGESMIYDWPTSAGNGTFRSCGYTAMRVGTGWTNNLQLLRPNPSKRHYFYTSGTPSTILGDALMTQVNGDMGLDAAGNLIVPFVQSSTDDIKWFVIPAAELNQAWAYDGFGAAEDVLSPTIGPLTNTGASSAHASFLGEHGGFYWFSYPWGSGIRFARFDKTTGAKSREQTILLSGYYGPGVIMGDDLFICPGQPSTQTTMLRYDLTVDPPSLINTITLAFPTWWTGYPVSMTFVGTEIIIQTTEGILVFNQSGDLIRIVGLLDYSAPTEATSSPYTSNRLDIGLHVWPQIFYYSGSPSGSASSFSNDGDSNGSYRGTTFNPVHPSFANQRIFWSGTHGLVTARHDFLTSPDNRWALGFAEAGHNLGSRVLLGSDTTKTSSNTMKITYNVTLPDFI